MAFASSLGIRNGSDVSEARRGRREIRKLASERILVLDGAWGTLIHGAGLGPEDYRGERFAAHPVDVTGDPDSST